MDKQTTYAIEENMYDDEFWFKFAFDATSEEDAQHKAWLWGRYHGLSSSDTRVRVATEEEATRSLHNEYIEFLV